MDIELPWTEKYRSKKLDDNIVGQEAIVRRLRAYVKQKNMPNLLFAGPPGVGKTLCAIALAYELFDDSFGQNFMELNASVTSDTPILVKKDKEIKRTNFEELSKEYFTDDKTERIQVDGLEILSIDQDYKIAFKPVDILSRHKVGKIAKIKYEGGFVKTSLDHSVIIINEKGELESKKTKDLKKSDLLITFTASIESASNKLNLKEHSPKKISILHGHAIANPKVKTDLDDLEVNEDIAWISGLYLSEGCTAMRGNTSGQVIFTLGYPQEQCLAAELQNTIRKSFGLPSKTVLGKSGFNRERESSIQVRFCNTQLANFFRSNFYNGVGGKAPDKRVPDFIFNSPLNSRISFLKGCALGDGSGEWGEFIRYSSSSKETLIDMAWLGRITGIDTSCFKNESRFVWKLPSHLYIKSEFLPSTTVIKSLEKTNNGKLKYFLRHALYSKRCKRISKSIVNQFLQKEKITAPSKMLKLIDSPLSVVKITEIQYEDYSDYVYDVAVPGIEMFWGGTAPILLHNSDARGIDVVREQIKSYAASLPFGGIRFKVIFLDEADALTRDAQNALRRTMENTSATTRFILSANYSSKIIEPIQSRCALFRFRPLSEDHITERLKHIAQKEKVHVDADGYKALVYASEGDMRKAINFLQTSSTLGEKVTEDTVYKIASKARPKEVRELIDLAMEGKFENARKKLDSLLYEYGLSGEDVILQLYRETIGLDMDQRKKVELIDKIGEYNFRMTEGANERIQLEALLAYLVLIGKK